MIKHPNTKTIVVEYTISSMYKMDIISRIKIKNNTANMTVYTLIMMIDKRCGDSLKTEYKRINNIKSKKYHWMKYKIPQHILI